MKKLSYILFGLLLMMACQNTTKNSVQTEEKNLVLTVDEIQEKGYDLVGQTIAVEGTVSHVCKHSGQRCFLMGSTENVTIRVEAGNKIGSFNQEQMGSDLTITGVLQEIRIDDAYIAELEVSEQEEQSANKDHALGHDGDRNHEVDGGNHNSDQMKHIAELKQKIATSGKGYYSIFYLDGISSKEVQ